MRCEEIMRRDVVIVTAESNVLDAAVAMREKGVGFIPVCSAEGLILGVLTDRDIVLRGCAARLALDATPVATVMTKGAVTCRAKDALAVAERAMRVARKARLPVVDCAGRVVGVLSLSDIAQYERPSRVGRILFDVSQRKYDPRTF